MSLMIAPALLLLLLWLAIAVARNPCFGVGAFMAMFAIDQLAIASFPAASATSWLVNVFVGALICAGAALAFRADRTVRLIAGPLHGAVVVLFVVSAVSTAWTPAVGAAVSEWFANSPYLILALFVVPLLVNTERSMKDACGTFVLTGALVVVIIVIFGEWSYRSFALQGGGGSEVRLPLALSQFCGYFILHLVFLKSKTVGIKVLVAVLALGAAVIMVRTGSRGQLFGLVAALALFVPASQGWGGRWNLLLALIAVPGWLSGTYYFVNSHGDLLGVPEFSERWSVESMSEAEDGRAEMISRVLRSWAGDPISIVIGLGSTASFSQQVAGSYPHNVYIEVLTEQGILGASILLGVIALTVYYAFSDLQHGFPLRRDRTIIYLFLALILYEGILALKQGSMLRNYHLWVFLIIFERLIIIRRTSRPGRVSVDRYSRAYSSDAVRAAKLVQGD